MELSDYMRLAQEYEELIQHEPPHLRLGKTLEFVRDNFKPEDVFITIRQIKYEPNCEASITKRTYL